MKCYYTNVVPCASPDDNLRNQDNYMYNYIACTITENFSTPFSLRSEPIGNYISEETLFEPIAMHLMD